MEIQRRYNVIRLKYNNEFMEAYTDNVRRIPKVDVEEIEYLQFGENAVLYGYRAYDETKKNVLYIAETPDDAKGLARAVQENNWYRAALF